MPERDVYGTRSNELLDPRLVGEGRAKALTMLCGQEALFVISTMVLQRGTKTVRGKFVDDMKGERRVSTSWCQSETCTSKGPTICSAHSWWGKALQGSSPRCVGKKHYLWSHDRLCDDAPRQCGHVRREQMGDLV